MRMTAADKIRAYHSLRQTGKEFCGRLLNVIPKDVLVSTAQELGLWKSGVLVADTGDSDILADRMIYDRRWDGRSCIEHFEARNGRRPASPCLRSAQPIPGATLSSPIA